MLDPMDTSSEALDWLGQPVSCRDCPHEAMHRDGRCRKGNSCVRDQRVRRVDRFFNEHPNLADAYLDHPYFEVRARAAKWGTVFRIPDLLEDPEPEVRAMAILRLPLSRVAHLANDPERRVRMAVASRMDGHSLIKMYGVEGDYHVRVFIVRRMAPELLVVAAHDTEADVRRWVARRLPVDRLNCMLGDPEPLVRMELAERLPTAQLHLLKNDPDLRVRFTVAERIDISDVAFFANDEDPLIRDLAAERLKSL